MGLFTEALFNFALFIFFASFHEYAHAWAAYKCGDSTAKDAGRLSLNPMVHIDIFWTLIIPILLLVSSNGKFALGAAKPVPVNSYRLRKPRRDVAFVGLAGPMSNLLWTLLLILVIKFLPISSLNQMLDRIGSAVYELLIRCMVINLVLLVFNMLPIHPLDGSRIVESLLPQRYISYYYKISPYTLIVLVALMYFGILSKLFNAVLYLVAVVFKI